MTDNTRVARLEAAMLDAAETFTQFAAAFREQGASAFAQEIAVAELAAGELLEALAQPTVPQP